MLLFPLHNEPSLMNPSPRLKTVGGVGFEVKMSLSSRAVFITCIIEKLIITHQEPIEGIKVWILLGYPSKYCNYTSKRNLRLCSERQGLGERPTLIAKKSSFVINPP